MKKFNFVYKTSAGLYYYIGQHKTDNLNDGYIGSSKFLKQYIKDNPELEIKREILCYCDNQTDLNNMEKYYISENIKDDYCINKICHGAMYERTEHQNNLVSKKLSGVKKSNIAKKHMRENHANVSGSNNPMYGKSLKNYLSEEEIILWKKRISDSTKGEKNPRYGTHCSDETKQRISESLKGKMSGSNNPMYGKKYAWVKKDDEQKYIELSKLEEYLLAGYERGKLR